MRNRARQLSGSARSRISPRISGRARDRTSTEAGRSWSARLGPYLCVVLLIAGLYGRSTGFELTGTDDKVLLVDDAPFLSDVSHLGAVLTRPFFPATSRGEAYYRPLVTATFILDAQWRGASPAAFHLTNVLLHALASCLLLNLLIGLGFSARPALLATLLFAAHPALVEAVVWIPGRCDMLLGIGFLIAMLCFVRFLSTSRTVWLAAHLAGPGLALLSKEAAVVIPGVLAGYVLLVDGPRGMLKKPSLWMGWLGVVAAWYALRSNLALEATSETIPQRLATIVANLPVLFVQVGKMVVPHNLSVLAYGKDSSPVTGAAVTVAAVAILAWLAGRARRMYLWGALVVLLFLLPTLAVSDFLILENRLYAPMVGVAVAGTAAVEQLRRMHRPWADRALSAMAAGALLASGAVTLGYSESFRTAAAFTEAAVRSSPHLALAHLNRGIEMHRTGDPEAAEREYRTALALDPSQVVVHNNLGLLYLNRGALADAERAFRREIGLNPRYDKAHFNLGLVLARRGNADAALSHWREAARLDPSNDEARRQVEAAERFGAEGPPTGAPAPGMTQVPIDQVPSDVLRSLYEDALARDPTNEQLRRAFAKVCAERQMECCRSDPLGEPANEIEQLQ